MFSFALDKKWQFHTVQDLTNENQSFSIMRCIFNNMFYILQYKEKMKSETYPQYLFILAALFALKPILLLSNRPILSNVGVTLW